MRSVPAAMRGWVWLAVLAVSGCGGNNSMGTVTGQVTVDGQPVELGAILFVPVDGNAQTSGGSIAAGRFKVQVPVGPMKVSISAPKVVGKKKIYPTANSPEMPITVEALPARYNEQTELTLQVVAGTNRKDFSLQGQ